MTYCSNSSFVFLQNRTICINYTSGKKKKTCGAADPQSHDLIYIHHIKQSRTSTFQLRCSYWRLYHDIERWKIFEAKNFPSYRIVSILLLYGATFYTVFDSLMRAKHTLSRWRAFYMACWMNVCWFHSWSQNIILSLSLWCMHRHFWF